MRIVLIRMIASRTDRTNAIVESAGPTHNVRGPEVSERAQTTSRQLLINSSPTKHEQIGKRLRFKPRIPAHTINLDLMLVSLRGSCPLLKTPMICANTTSFDQPTKTTSGPDYPRTDTLRAKCRHQKQQKRESRREENRVETTEP